MAAEDKSMSALINFTAGLIALNTALLEIMIDRGVVSAEDARSRLAKIREELTRSNGGLVAAGIVEQVWSKVADMYGLPETRLN